LNNVVTECARPEYRLLNPEQIDLIHQAVLELLETGGVRVLHPEGMRLLSDAGAVAEGADRVRIPRRLVEAALRTAPSAIMIYDRTGQPAMQLEGRNLHFGLGTDLLRTVDLDTGETRPSLLKDVIQAARVADACPEIDFIASFALPHDTPTNTMYIECFKAELENSTKPIFFTAACDKDLAYILAMAARVAGGEEALRRRPFLINYSEPTPPLTHSYGAVSKLLMCAHQGVPICYTPAAMMGASAPVTIAGGLVQTIAEALSGLVIHQMAAPGAPIISGLGLPVLDPRTACVSYAAPELRLSNSAFIDVFHHYGLPVWSTTGSDSHSLDEQAAMEHAFAILMASLDGANLVHDVGYLGQGLLGHPASIVMCSEMISYVKHVRQGFALSDEALGLDVIREVGPGGNYLAHEHTLRHFRRTLWAPTLSNRMDPAAWQAQGGQTYRERVVKKTKAILQQHRPAPLDPAIATDFACLIQDARAALENEVFAA
jgi:trimethylamine--corrinoid protein Co-methyltransferase